MASSSRKRARSPSVVPDVLFERRLFPVSFSCLSHIHLTFPAWLLIVFQSGAFGGLLPGHTAMSLDQAKSVLRRLDSGEGEGSRSSKRFKGKAPVRVESDSEPENVCEESRSSKRFKGKAPVRVESDSEPENACEDAGLLVKESQPPVALGVCLRCSKRIDQVSEHTLRNKTVPVGHRCNLTPYHKCSYCALTSHDCEPVSTLLPYMGLPNVFAGSGEVSSDSRRSR